MKRLFFIFISFLIACTNPFDTREPKPPLSNNQIQPISNLQNNPDSLFKQLQFAFQEPNWNYYDALIVDSAQLKIDFTFVPQQEAAYRLQNWTRQDEQNYFRRLVTNKDRNDLFLQIFNIQGPVQIGASQDTLQVQFSYQIKIDLKIKREYYEGQGIFKIFRSSQSLWYIYYWEDLKSGSDLADSTWSILKAAYR